MNTKPFIIVLILFVASIAVFAEIASCQREQIRERDAEIEDAQRQIDLLNAEMSNAAQRIDEASKRIDDAIQAYSQGMNHAYKNHETRMEAIAEIEADESSQANDWMCQPVPDDVCRMLDEYTGPMHTNSDD